MRKAISFILVLLLVFTGNVLIFAADAAVPDDVKGTKYEAAVIELMEKAQLAGYPDGSFRPDSLIERAEICSIVVNAMNPTAEEKGAAPDAFNDMGEYGWALEAVNYAAFKNVVSGYGGGRFGPSNPVTYNEMTAILVNALGFSEEDLTGNYPDNYVAKAKELGILDQVDIEGKGDDSATRGDVALMTASVVDQIIDAHKQDDTELPVEPDKPSVATESGISGDNAAFKAGSGAFGVINGVSTVMDSNGDKVTQLEFYMGGKTYYLNADSDNIMGSPDFDGGLYYIKFNMQQAVKSVEKYPSSTPKRFAALAGSSDWVPVSVRENTEIVVTEGGVSKSFNVMRDAVYYRAVLSGNSIDSYEAGRLSEIGEGAFLRAYDVTDDNSSVADVIIYVTEKDAQKLGL